MIEIKPVGMFVTFQCAKLNCISTTVYELPSQTKI
jgi:hypothetical protein